MGVQDELNRILSDFLELTVPSKGWTPNEACDDKIYVDVPCYDAPEAYEHLAPVTWFGTARLLVLCATLQFSLVLLALAWDLWASIAVRCGKAVYRVADMDTGYTPLELFFDCLELSLSVASCITFVVRAYASSAYEDYVLKIVYVVDWTIAVVVLIFYVVHWTKADSKFYYSLSRQPLLNVITITSCALVQVVQEGWVPFTFLRSLTINSALRRIFKLWDLPELYEQLTLAVADFLALVFTFAGLIFMLENLGNPPGWELEESSHLSFFKSLWFVTVTVSTVGYGDISPVSFLGKAAGIVFIVVGVYFFSTNISHISMLLQSQVDGNGRYSVQPGNRHIVLTGEVEPVTLRDFAIEFFHREHDQHRKGGMDLCLVTPEKVDVERYIISGEVAVSRLQMLRGSIPSDLDRIAIARVQAFFFLGDPLHPNPLQHDGELLLRAFETHKNNRDAELYMTVLNPESLNTATGTVALCYTSFKTGLLAKSTFCPGVIPLIGNLLISVDWRSVSQSATKGTGKRLTGDYLHGLQHEMYKVRIPAKLRGQRFGEVVLHNFITYGILIFALGTDEGDASLSGSKRGKGLEPEHEASVRSIAVHPGYAHEIEEDVAFIIAHNDPQQQFNESVKTFFGKLQEGLVDPNEDMDSSEESPVHTHRNLANTHPSIQVSGGNMGNLRGEEHRGQQHAGADATTHSSDQDITSNVEHLYAARHHDTRLSMQNSSGDLEQLAVGPRDRSRGVANEDVKSMSSAHSGRTRRSNRVHPLPPPIMGHGVIGVGADASTLGATTTSTSAHGVEAGVSTTGHRTHQRVMEVDSHAVAPRELLTNEPKPDAAHQPQHTSESKAPLASAQRPPEFSPAQLRSVFDIAAALRPRVKRVVNSVQDLKPNLRHNQGDSHGVVDMQDHVIVCGMPQRLQQFLEPFKRSMNGNSIKRSSKSGQTRVFESKSDHHNPDELSCVVPVLFLWDGPITPEILSVFQGQPEAYLLRVPPLNPSSLIMANPGQAMRIHLLTDYRLASQASELELIDSGVIFAQRFIRQRFPWASRKYVCELVENENMHYLEDRHGDESSKGCVLISTEPVFSEGAVFSSSLCTNTLAQSFYNKDVLPLVGALLSCKVTNFNGRCSVGEVELLQAEVPEFLQNKPYQDLMEAFLRPGPNTALDLLPLGLYRRHDGIGENYWYTFTNPSPDTVVRSEDCVFYVQRTKSWKEEP